MGILYLIRGLPGSGKTTLATMFHNMYGYQVHEADDFFTDDEGVYHYDSKWIRKAHNACFVKIGQYMSKHPHSAIVVCNTFVTEFDMQAYFALAKHYKWTIQVILTQGHFKSIHNVPDYVIERMKADFCYTPTALYEKYS
jgi:predicted kinase